MQGSILLKTSLKDRIDMKKKSYHLNSFVLTLSYRKEYLVVHAEKQFMTNIIFSWLYNKTLHYSFEFTCLLLKCKKV